MKRSAGAFAAILSICGGAAACSRSCAPLNAGWSYLPLEGVKCGRGEKIGIGVNRRDGAKRLLLFFVGGGACFDKMSCDPSCKMNVQLCAANLDGFGPEQWAHEDRSPPGTILDRSDPTNPFRDDHLVFIPYCTGDFHAGSRRAEYGIDHLGWDVVSAALSTITPMFPDLEQVVLYGVSAGGFGVVFNYEHVRAAFPQNVKLDLIDDSGPMFSRAWMPLEEEMSRAWGSMKNAPAECAECGGDWEKYWKYLSAKYPEARLSLATYLDDPVIAAGFGGPLLGAPGFSRALDVQVKEVFAPLPNVRVFIAPGIGHGVGKEAMSKVVAGGVRFSDFLQKQISGDPAWANAR